MALTDLERIKGSHIGSLISFGPRTQRCHCSVYNRCPNDQVHLWRILKGIWRRGRFEKQWRFAKAVWISKEENSKWIESFRMISLLNTDKEKILQFPVSTTSALFWCQQLYRYFWTEGRDCRPPRFSGAYRCDEATPKRNKIRERLI